jgi:peptide deformylase
MAVREIVKYPDPILLNRTKEVEKINPDIRRLVRDMVETMHAAPGVGLAANQVGVPLRVAVIDLSVGEDPSQLLVLVNPRILSLEGMQAEEEGCLSVPGITEVVQRPSVAEVEALNLDGKTIRVRGEALMARALLHEIDHLNGVVFIEHLSPLKRALARKKIRKLIQTGEWAAVGS